ncbi:MAG: hypothetical protein ACRD50_07685 [Candidatus Acidiferrales bacterium]
MMACNAFLEFLEPWMEGERRPDAAAHLASCDRCRSLVADLAAIRSSGLALGNEIIEPPDRIWASLRAQLQEERLIHPHGWRAWLREFSPAFPTPALVGVYAAVLLIAGFLAASQQSRLNEAFWRSGTQSNVASLDSRLQSVSLSVQPSAVADPDVARSLRKSLVQVDNYIALCKKSVESEPQSEMARDFLFDAYQQKAQLLASMSEHGVMTQ